MMTLKKPQDVIHVHVSYVPTPGHLGEPKTKPTQLSVRTLNRWEFSPILSLPAAKNIWTREEKTDLALFCNMHKEDVISSPDLPSVYEIPLVLHKQELETKIMKKLGLAN